MNNNEEIVYKLYDLNHEIRDSMWFREAGIKTQHFVSTILNREILKLLREFSWQ